MHSYIIIRAMNSFIRILSTLDAIPINVNEIKEIYDLIEKSKFNKTTLFSTYRHSYSLQFQTFYLSYTFIKYQKKVHNIPHKLLRFRNSFYSNFDYALFCINTNAHQNSELSKQLFLIVMENLFPKQSPYEIIENSKLSIAIKIIKQLIDEKNELQSKLIKLEKEMIKFDNLNRNKTNSMKEIDLNKDKLRKNISERKKILICSLVLSLVSFMKIII